MKHFAYLIPFVFIAVMSGVKSIVQSQQEGQSQLSSISTSNTGDAIYRRVKSIRFDTITNALTNTKEHIIEETVEEDGLHYIRTQLDLDKETENDIVKMLKDNAYLARMIPFILMMKDNYTLEAHEERDSFNHYAFTHRRMLEVPGTNHQLFEWDEANELVNGTRSVESDDKNKRPGRTRRIIQEERKKAVKESSPSFVTKIMIENLIGIAHQIFKIYRPKALSPEEIFRSYHEMSKADKDQRLLESVKPLVAKVLKELSGTVAKGVEGEMTENIGDFLKMLEAYENQDTSPEAKVFRNRFEAITVSFIDFVASMAHRSYRIYLSKWVLRKQMKKFVYEKIDKWEEEDYDKADPQKHPMRELQAFVKMELREKRYALQIGVGGLQRGLLQALTNIGKDNPFVEQVLMDDQGLQELKITDTENVGVPKVKPVHEFLQYAMNNQNSSYYDVLYLPYFKKLLNNPSYKHGIVENGISTTPTSSLGNLPTIFTGSKASGEHAKGLPNFHSIDREINRAFYFFGNDDLNLDSLTEKAAMITQFDRMNKLGIESMNCNAQYDWTANTTLDPLINLGLGEASRDFGELLCYHNLKTRARVQKELDGYWREMSGYIDDIFNKTLGYPFDWVSRDRIRKLLKDGVLPRLGEGMPQYVLWYNPWPGHFAHFYGPFADAITSPTGELNRLDYWLGKMNGIYRNLEVSDRTLFGLAGDHGLSPIYKSLNPEELVLNNFAKESGREVLVKKISSDKGGGFKFKNAAKSNPADGYDVEIASEAGGNYVLNFFFGKNSGKWKEHPTFDDLVAHPILKDGRPVNWIKEITERLSSSLDYLVVRNNQCSRKKASVPKSEKESSSEKDYEACLQMNQDVFIIGPRGGQVYRERIVRFAYEEKGGFPESILFYKPSEGDLLGLTNNFPKYNIVSEKGLDIYKQLYIECVEESIYEDKASWCTEKKWKQLTSYTDRPGSVSQLSHLYDSDRAGTINLFPKYGVAYNTNMTGRHGGESFHEKDTFVGVWGDPIENKGLAVRSTENGSVAPTIFQWLSGRNIKKEDGFKYEPLYWFK
ncbi:MAG: alkaline phosphatase family protein [Bdellovibrionota bacterium]|nr:alkaline phosphatase family protein [Bdellovibrionota bacterium]